MSRVSIVLPTYNGEKYIRESIDSILAQTYKDWELIIVNDCSNDATMDIITSYINRDSRIRVIVNKENQKLPQSLNIGFREAQGELLTWTSDDNYYITSAIEKMVNHMDLYAECQMVVADMENMDATGNVIGRFASYSDELMLYNDCVGACFMYRKSAQIEIGEYDPKWFLVEDYEYWLRFLLKYKHIDRIDEVLYRYRYHDKSLTGSRLCEIRQQLNKLRKVHLNEICHGLKDNRRLLTCVFVEMVHAGLDMDEAQPFYDGWPLLKMIKPLTGEKPVAIFGAGNYGEKACKILGSRAKCFVDSNPEKIGKEKHGIKVFSMDDYMNNMYCTPLVIAISDSNVHSVIELLASRGINECSLIQMVDGWNE